MPIVLVTGAGGFIGQHVSQALIDDGYSVVALDESLGALQSLDDKCVKALLVLLRVNDIANLKEPFDAVVHLAAVAAPRIAEANPDLTFKVNVQGTYSVLKKAVEAGAKRVIFTSSAHVYGISPKYMPTNETHPLYLLDAYTTSKVLGEKLCALFYQNHNLSYCALRLFNGYGPGQSLGYFIPDMIRKASNGENIALKGGSITKDFVYVDDIVSAILLALESDYVGPLNVGTGVQTTLESVAQKIADAHRVSLTCVDTDDKGPTHMQANIERIRGTLGWKPRVNIGRGLETLLGLSVPPTVALAAE